MIFTAKPVLLVSLLVAGAASLHATPPPRQQALQWIKEHLDGRGWKEVQVKDSGADGSILRIVAKGANQGEVRAVLAAQTPTWQGYGFRAFVLFVGDQKYVIKPAPVVQ